MWNIFKSFEEKKNPMLKGILIGVGVAVIAVAVVLGVLFGGKIIDKIKALTGGAVSGGDKTRITMILKKDCADCLDINPLVDAIKQSGIEVSGQETIYVDDKAGRALVEKYQIEKVPTLLLAGKIEQNEALKNLLALGDIANGVFVFREVIPPYFEVATGQVRGRFSLTYLTDQSRKECYDATTHLDVLQSFYMTPTEVKTIDIAGAEGKELIEKYGIASAPTILLNGEVEEYPNFSEVWSTVGAVASDGTYVFTGVDQMGTYKDLAKNKVIVVKTEPSAATTGQ